MANILHKRIAEFIYIQSLTFCLTNDDCNECKYRSDEEYVIHECSLFTGKFMFMPSRTKDWLTSLRLALNIHYENCSTCKSCIFKSYNKEAFECYYTSFISRIGENVWADK